MAPGDAKPHIDFVDSNKLMDPKYWSSSVTVNQTGRLVFTSGLVGQDKDGKFPDSFGEQVQLAFANLQNVLAASGASMRDVVKITFYPVDWSMEKAKAMFEPYVVSLTEKYGFTGRPITTTVPVATLGYPEAKFEVEAVDAISGNTTPFDNGSFTVKHPVPAKPVDVVVVGGGFSGCQAAFDLQEAGLDTVLLEAKHRIGGRSRSQQLRSGPGLIELGATWINETTQPKAFALAKKFGLDLLWQYEPGDTLWQTPDGVTHRLKDGDITGLGDGDKLTILGKLNHAIDEAYKLFELNKPTLSPAELDVSLAEWIRTKVGDTEFGNEIGRHLAAALVGREPDEVGAHYILDYLKSCGGLQDVGGEGKYGAQSLKIRQGTTAIATGLCHEAWLGAVEYHGYSIEQHEQGKVLVGTSNGYSFLAKKVILALPTNTYDYIRFSPPLPEAKRALVSRTLNGIYSKVILTYKSAWWRDLGLSGKFTSLIGPICFSWEISDPVMSQYSLALFVSGPWAKKWQELSNLGKEEAVVLHLAELVGTEHAHLAKDVLEYNYMEWHKEDFILGAPTSSMGPGLLAKYGDVLREPFKDIHIAGGETAYEWKGFLEGALRAGTRAANEVIPLLQGEQELVPKI